MPLSVDESSHDHGKIQDHPADTWQIYILVLFLYSEPEPEESGKQISAPREYRDTGCLMTQPNRQDLWDGHQESEDRHSSQYATQFCLRSGRMNVETR